MRAVILAGGKGTRLAPYTTVFPKPLMPVGDMPILEVVVRQLKAAGFDHITLAVGHLAELLQAFFGDGSRFGLRIDYSVEDQPLGTAGPLTQIAGLQETFLVMNGDILTTLDYRDLLSVHRAHGSSVTVASHDRTVAVDFGVIEVGAADRIEGYVEKPSLRYRVSMGVYVFEPAALRFVPSGERMDFPDLMLALIAAGEPVHTYPFSGYWLDIGRPDDYARAVEEFDTRRGEFLPGQVP